MSIRSSSSQSAGQSANKPVFDSSFQQHIHELIRMGHARLDASEYQYSEEPAITGELRRSIDAVLEDDTSPEWVIHYDVHEETPVDKNGILGKRRQRIDIMIKRIERGPRRRLHFEAKRLHNTSSVTNYLGKEGLGCFLAGEYAYEQNEAGMLGYVQAEEETVWAGRIKTCLNENHKRYALLADGWKENLVISKLPYTYKTSHNRIEPNIPITIYHIFLKFF